MSQVFSLSYLPNLIYLRNLFSKHLFNICWKQMMLILFRKKPRKISGLIKTCRQFSYKMQFGWTLTFLLQATFITARFGNLPFFFFIPCRLTFYFFSQLFSFWHIFCMISVHVCYRLIIMRSLRTFFISFITWLTFNNCPLIYQNSFNLWLTKQFR